MVKDWKDWFKKNFAKDSKARKAAGVVLIILGFLALVTPLTPGAWLIFIGLEFLGFRMAIWGKIKEKFFKDARLATKFWDWYERHYELNLKIATFLFFWQMVHLVWMAIVVVLPKALNYERPDLPKWFNLLVALVDYTEIPALIGTSLIYINELRKGWKWKNFWLLLFLNSQWLHLFWITDEFVLDALTGQVAVQLPLWLAWLAIMIDYLEVPVMYDTLRKYLALGKRP